MSTIEQTDVGDARERVFSSVVVIVSALALVAVLAAPREALPPLFDWMWQTFEAPAPVKPWTMAAQFGLPPLSLKTPIVLMHVIGFALGAGIAMLLDAFILWRLNCAGRLTGEEARLCRFSARLVALGLALLWVSGLAFLLLGAASQPASLLNPKLWAKIAVVFALTLNGLLVHRLVFQQMDAATGWVPGRRNWRIAATAALSAASWIAATLFGTVKELNYAVPFVVLMTMYGVLLCVCLAGAFLCLKRIGAD